MTETTGSTRKTLYTAAATVRGGRGAGHGVTSDGFAVDLRMPPELGGEGGGTNPEQLFAIGYAACFEGAIGGVSRRMRIDPGDVSIDARVSLHPTPEKGFALSVEMDVTLPDITDAEQAREIVATAHQVCPYSAATRGSLDVTLTANGEPV